MTVLGKIVKSNSHTDYVCQIYGKHEIESLPTNTDYAFGTFVSIELSEYSALIGLIYDTVLLNPDFGRLGPRLSTASDLALFSPDYLNERATIVGIVIVGQVNNGSCRQGTPYIAANSDSLVHRLPEDGILGFHEVESQLQIGYLPQLIQRSDPLTRQLALVVVQQLGHLIPQQIPLLNLLEDDLCWQLQISAMGRT
jgi:hypothetical protein